MAKHNQVFLYGQIAAEPKIRMNDETGAYERGSCPIVVMRGVRDFGNNVEKIKYDVPLIMTSNPDQVAEMAKWHTGDMIEVKGAVTTKDVTKAVRCKNCGTPMKKKGNVVYVNPIYMGLRETNVPENQRTELLKKRCEISNQVTLVGTLCREPAGFITEKGLNITTYQLAINRKFRIKEDPAEVKTDFPWVKSYGAIAENDIKTLKKGSYILIDGRIQTRQIERTNVCESCGQEFKWNDSALEIVPYATEYLRDYYTKEELEQKEAEELKAIKKEIFSEDDIERPEDEPSLIDNDSSTNDT